MSNKAEYVEEKNRKEKLNSSHIHSDTPYFPSRMKNFHFVLCSPLWFEGSLFQQPKAIWGSEFKYVRRFWRLDLVFEIFNKIFFKIFDKIMAVLCNKKLKFRNEEQSHWVLCINIFSIRFTIHRQVSRFACPYRTGTSHAPTKNI